MTLYIFSRPSTLPSSLPSFPPLTPLNPPLITFSQTSPLTPPSNTNPKHLDLLVTPKGWKLGDTLALFFVARKMANFFIPPWSTCRAVILLLPLCGVPNTESYLHGRLCCWTLNLGNSIAPCRNPRKKLKSTARCYHVSQIQGPAA